MTNIKQPFVYGAKEISQSLFGAWANFFQPHQAKMQNGFFNNMREMREQQPRTLITRAEQGQLQHADQPNPFS